MIMIIIIIIMIIITTTIIRIVIHPSVVSLFTASGIEMYINNK